MKCILSFLLLTVFFILSGCTQLPEKPSEADQISLWLEHQIAVGQIYSWDISGRVGIKTDRDSGSATLHWHQFGSDFEMRIIAPLGQGTYIFRGSPAGVVMLGPDNVVITADNPEQLMLDALGWSVNLAGMQYWIRGIPEPDTTYSKLSLDGYGRLGYLDQAGFSIEIQRYAELEKFSLPEKLTIKSDDLQLKMVIKSWEL